MTADTTPRKQSKADLLFKWVTALCAAGVIVLMAAILYELVRQSGPSIHKFGLGFLGSQSWDPVAGDFGAASSIFGTLVTSAIAMLIAAPLAIVIALLLVELAPPAISSVVGGAIELLAAIPSIIFGMWGMYVFSGFMSRDVQPFLHGTLGALPWLGRLFSGSQTGFGVLTAGVILALMVLPFITAVTRDALAMVPAVVKESAYGMGATTWEVTRKVSLRYCVRGVFGAMFLGLGRALGETMAVTFVIGNAHRMSASLFSEGNTIASTLANEFSEATDPLHLSALVELGLILFVISLVAQILAHWWLSRGPAAGGAP